MKGSEYPDCRCVACMTSVDRLCAQIQDTKRALQQSNSHKAKKNRKKIAMSSYEADECPQCHGYNGEGRNVAGPNGTVTLPCNECGAGEAKP